MSISDDDLQRIETDLATRFDSEEIINLVGHSVDMNSLLFGVRLCKELRIGQSRSLMIESLIPFMSENTAQAIHASLIFSNQCFNDLTPSFITVKSLESLLPKSCRVDHPINLSKGGLVAYVKIGAYEAYKKRCDQVKNQFWANLGRINSNEICRSHCDYTNELLIVLNIDSKSCHNWESVGQNLALCGVHALKAVTSLPNVDPVEKANVKKFFTHKSNSILSSNRRLFHGYTSKLDENIVNAIWS